MYHDKYLWDGTHACYEGLGDWIKKLEDAGCDLRGARFEATCWAFRDDGHALEIDGQSVEPGDTIVWREFDGLYIFKKIDPMLEFDDPEDKFIITGRGVCYSSSKWKLPEGVWEPWDLSGLQAKICGVEVKIIGVDAFCIARSPKSPYRLSFALCVSEEDAEKIGWSR